MNKKLLLSLGLCGLVGASLQGSIAVQYDFEDSLGNASAAPVSGSVNASLLSSASDVSGGSASGVGDNTSDPFSSTTGFRSIFGTQATDWSASFTLTTAASIGAGEFDFTNMVFKVAKSGSSVTYVYNLTSDRTGATVLATGNITPTVTADGTFQKVSVDLTGFSGLQNLGGSAATTFTIALDYQGGSSSPTARLDKIQVEGLVTPVPEPSTYALLAGFLAMGLVMFRRRLRA